MKDGGSQTGAGRQSPRQAGQRQGRSPACLLAQSVGGFGLFFVAAFDVADALIVASIDFAWLRWLSSVGSVVLAKAFTSGSLPEFASFRNSATSFVWSLTMSAM